MRPRGPVLEVVAFAALAWYAAAHWAGGLVAAPAGARVFGCVVIATAAATALALVREMPQARVWLLRLGVVTAAIGAGAVSTGLERRFLSPAGWDELGAGLDRGFAGLGSVEWPYAGPERWTELTLLLAVPLVLGAATAFAFWPNRALRPLGLVLLVTLYGVAVTEHRFDGELGRGVGLLVLVAAWLWLPRLAPRGWRAMAVAAGAVAAACVVALPAAARYDDREGWVDYESWNPFAEQAASRFDWSHSYGPIDWPRDGSTMMYVRSPKRHYWRLETLDRFDGRGWLRATDGGEVPILPEPRNEEWESRFEVTIADLDTDLFPIAGTMLEITRAEPFAAQTDDGTVVAVGESLDEGDSYDVRAYVPDPTPARMRTAPLDVPFAIDYGNTSVFLPGSPAPAAPGEIARSPYAGVQALARRLAAGRRSTYDVVRAIQGHLRSPRYTYDERPPRRRYPLAAFLLRDRLGYCQQFSGAMALMLRMLGIPARVAAGFSPGSYDEDAREYRVRDLDAHSWVEVWFTGIGWVPFDPTPSVAPADLQSSPEAASASAGASGPREVPDPRGAEQREVDGAAGASSPDDGDRGTGWLLLGALLAVATAAAVGATVLARFRRATTRTEEAEIAELRRALARVGEPVPPRTTLRDLETTLESAAPAAARYVRLLRMRRYSPRGGRPPGPAARRDLRRALARGRGLRGRIAAFTALPPVSFRRG